MIVNRKINISDHLIKLSLHVKSRFTLKRGRTMHSRLKIFSLFLTVLKKKVTYFQFLPLTKKVQEVLCANFDESSIVRKISLWGLKNSMELPVTNQLLSRYPTIYFTTICLFIAMHLCCYICHIVKLIYFTVKWLTAHLLCQRL